MKTLTRITLAALAALACARASAARGQEGWVEFAPAGEGFAALMPKQPESRAERARAGVLSVTGRRYAAKGDDGNTYLVWSLEDPAGVGSRLGGENYADVPHRGDAPTYLDEVAELAWGLLITPELERLKREDARRERWAGVGMAYRRAFELDGHPAREYAAGLEKSRGTVYVCADGPRVYVVAALGPDAQAPQLKQFVESFGFGSVRRARPSQPAGDARGVGHGVNSGVGDSKQYNAGAAEGGAPVDYDRPFTQREVTQKAVITYKAEPGYTESARKFNVTGAVRLRAALAATGEVKEIVIVKGLPHGLTWKCVEAARGIRFEPAQKDGRAVSQYVILEYNFNIY